MHRGVFVFQAMESLKRAVPSSTAAQPAMRRRASNTMARTWLCSRWDIWENNSPVRFLRTLDLCWRSPKTKSPHVIVLKSDSKAMLTRQTFMLNSHLLLKSDFQMFRCLNGTSLHTVTAHVHKVIRLLRWTLVTSHTECFIQKKTGRQESKLLSTVFHVYHRPGDSRSWGFFFSPVKCDLGVQTFKKVQYRSDPSIWKWPESGLKMSDSLWPVLKTKQVQVTLACIFCLYFFIVVFDVSVILCVLDRRKWTPVRWYRLCSVAWPTTPTCRRAAKSTKRPRTARKARDPRKNPWRSDHLSAISSFAPCGLWNEWVCVSELVPAVCLRGLVLTGDPPASAR